RAALLDLESPAAHKRGGVPPGQARNLDHIARVRGVDEVAAADVDADVAEPVEENEIARLELAARNGRPVAVLRRGVVRQRDADLREHVHHEAGAVEARGRRAAPNVRNTEVAHRDPDDAAVVGRWCYTAASAAPAASWGRDGLDDRLLPGRLTLRRKPRRELALELGLAGALLGLQLHDLAANRAEQCATLAELRLNRRLGRRTLADDLNLLRVRVLQLDLALLHLSPEVGDLLDVRELDVREVVRLDRALQARVELLDLRKDALGLRLLGRDRISGCRNSRRCCERCQGDD